MITLEVSKQEAHEIRVALSCSLLELERWLPSVNDEVEVREIKARIEVIGNLIEAVPTGY
jgi:hypothetical protein